MNTKDIDTKHLKLLNTETGEQFDLDIFAEKVSKRGWQRAYAENVADYFRIAKGDTSVRILAYLLEVKDGKNQIVASQREISRELNVSLDAVSRVIKALMKRGLIELKKQGVYMLDPQIMRYGSKTAGVITMKLWGDLKNARK